MNIKQYVLRGFAIALLLVVSWHGRIMQIEAIVCGAYGPKDIFSDLSDWQYPHVYDTCQAPPAKLYSLDNGISEERLRLRFRTTDSPAEVERYYAQAIGPSANLWGPLPACKVPVVTYYDAARRLNGLTVVTVRVFGLALCSYAM